ncbi:MAG: ABC transporter permease subunit, partial [Clostridia bacterium]|nr:ABC transporter permease subunit [Clostridia bacterium]
MKNVLTIIKKEFSRFFKDRRMIITVLLPGLLIYLVYSLMGSVMSSVITPDGETTYSAYVVNMPETLLPVFDEILEVDDSFTEESAQKAVAEGTLDILVIFPDHFDEVLMGTDKTGPDVKILYNSSFDSSFQGYIVISSVLEGFKQSSFTINLKGDNDLAGEKESAGKMLAMFMPMLMFALLVSGCVAVAPEAIAGEKERGTMATMLITPIKRWELALGKILSLTCFALLSGISSFLGVILSLPKLMGGLAGGDVAVYY